MTRGVDLAEFSVSWGRLLQTRRAAASQPGSWVQFLECRRREGRCVCKAQLDQATILAGKPPGKEELLQEMLEPFVRRT